MLHKKVLNKLKELNQLHLIDKWETFNPHQRQVFISHLEALNVSIFEQQQSQILHYSELSHETYLPFSSYDKQGSEVDRAEGRALLSQGTMGCLVTAGGQGTRLRFEGPKGKFPVTLIRQKSLFQLFAEKAVAASKQAGRPLLLAIMTSPLNHQETIHFFQSHHFFGLEESQLSFFCQETLPFVDDQGNLVIESSGAIASGPAGNGTCFKHFVTSGIWERWHHQGIRYINYVTIDNALADPFDINLLGYHHRMGGDITIKCTERNDEKEKMGLIVEKEKRPVIIEYFELSEKEGSATDETGTLKHRCANLSLFCFNMDFVRYAASQISTLPWHLAKKTINTLDSLQAWKFEKFIFDVLPLAKKVTALLYPRDLCFAPLKNYNGRDSLATVQSLLQNYDRHILEEEWGRKAPDFSFELAPEFYYPTEKAKALFLCHSFPFNPYIELESPEKQG